MPGPQRLSISPPKVATTPDPIFTKHTRVLSGSSSTPQVVKDTNVLRYTDAGVIDEWSVELPDAFAKDDYRLLLGQCKHKWPAKPAAAYSNFSLEGWHIRAAAPGTGTLAIYDGFARKSQLYSFECNMTSPASVDAFSSWVNGSLIHALDESTTSTAALVTSEDLWTTYSPSTNTFVYNPNSIAGASGYKVAGFAAWNSSTGGRAKGGVLITPEHVLYTLHYKPSPGNTVKFVEADGTVQTRTIQYVDAVPDGFDQVIATLSEPITTISPIPMISRADAVSKMPTFSSWDGPVSSPEGDTLAFVLDQHSRCRTLRTGRGGVATSMRRITDGSAQFPAPDAVAGDSGSPAFWMLGGFVVLIGTTTFTTWSGGPATHAARGDFEAITANRGLTPTYLNASSFPSY